MQPEKTIIQRIVLKAFALNQCSNLGLNNQNWIYVLALKNNVIISIPSKKFEYYTNKINVINSQSLVCIADILNILHNDIEKISPILYQSYMSRAMLNCGQNSVKLLSPSDLHLLEEFRSSCSEDEWSESSIQIDPTKDVYGLVQDNMLIAAAHYLSYPGNLASIGVLTHPLYRGKGHGLTVALSVAKCVFEKDLVVHYQTKIENHNSISIACRLGCKHFGYSVKLKMK